MVTDPVVDGATDRLRLVADCGRCRALCCIAPGFTRSADFPISKPAGTPCPNLGGDLRCTIHDRLRPSGFRGCVAFDCFGAGQRVSELTAADPADEVAYRLLPVVRLLHELEWYLLEVLALDAARPQHPAAADALAATRALAARPVGALLTADVESHRRTVAPVLRAASAAVRSAPDAPDARRAGRPGGPGRSTGRDLAGRDLAGADLAGADLRGEDLRRADLRGAVLLAADLAGADLRGADLLGADTRDADLSGADLRDVLFATRTQLDGARGDASTRLPDWAPRPHHWG